MKNFQIIDLVRSFSVLAVLAVHSSSFTRPLENPWAHFVFYHFQRNGSYGVFLFFVVSGFLITRILDLYSRNLFKPDIPAFYTRRLGRILPLLVLTVLLAAMAWALLPQDSQRVRNCFGIRVNGPMGLFWLSIITFTFNWLFFVPNWILSVGWYWGLLWSLSIEEQFYLLFPFALKRFGNPAKLTRFLLAVILASFLWRLAAYFFIPVDFYLKYYNSLEVFDLIAIGVLLYLVSKRHHGFFKARKGTSLIVCLAGFLLMLADYWGTFYSDRVDQVYASTALGFGLFVFLLGGIHLPFFDSKYLKFLSLPGKYCYGMYLLHPFVLFFVGSDLPKMNGLLAFLFFSILTTVIAGISYHFFEMPVNQFIRRLGKAS